MAFVTDPIPRPPFVSNAVETRFRMPTRLDCARHEQELCFVGETA